MSAFSVVPTYGWNTPTLNPALFELLPFVASNGLSAELVWAQVPGAIQYKVYAGRLDEPLCHIADTTSLSYNVTGLQATSVYSFLVVAVLGDAQEQCSDLATNQFTMAITGGQNVDGQAQINFQFNQNAVGYNIYVATSSGEETPPSLPEMPLVSGIYATLNADGALVTGLTPNTTYYFMVQMATERWVGPASNELGAPPITWDPNHVGTDWALSNSNFTATYE